MTGTILKLLPNAYGFLRGDDAPRERLFFHAQNLRTGLIFEQDLRVGQRVTFERVRVSGRVLSGASCLRGARDSIRSRYCGTSSRSRIRPSMKRELLLRPSRLTYLALAGLLGALSLRGAWRIWQGNGEGWIDLVVWGLFALLMFAQTLPFVSSLKLTDEGFEMKSLGRRHRWRWEDVSNFRVIKMKNVPQVGFDVVPPDDGRQNPREVAYAFTGADAALGDTYGRTAQELVDLMTDWKRGARTFDR